MSIYTRESAPSGYCLAEPIVPYNAAPNPPSENRRSKDQVNSVDISRWIGSAKGCFGSVKAVDDYIRRERNAWD
uniref:Uncharacterized protein n=1 Tax=Candidatus Kentrum sp. DK TaxID=2126562 RepID=A0A450S6R5_9GAMM|nr:MAG: hypothetical protein BECKDK2373C_GA0170839_101310 [Candidatus Kentron sp. DK]VFJ47604.1 MAG: hypothetical protein BECKDK2373B_GA0170837_101747 [Candidatus Kentron sp. DK]